jgi:hypothetical protein
LATSVFRLSIAQLERLIHDRAKQPMLVSMTVHALMRMKERHVLRSEVIEVLECGHMQRPGEPNLARGSLECRLQRFVSGRELAVVAAVSDDHPQVIVVTAIVVD